MTKNFIAYVRVSTQRQGAQGTSLAEQQRAIESYAKKRELEISSWHEEHTTAAKRGRPVFDRVIAELQGGCGDVGLLLHKVDRGARNLRDWASIGEAIDLGVDVRFAHDDFDLTTRGGRLAADIQAVIAADYIRNLREEVKKGIQGRLRQGLYPFGAPRGYRNSGGGRVKVPDPIVAPLIIAAFERYATGVYTLNMLAADLSVLGLTNSTGKPLSANAMSHILRNPFYVGKMRVNGKIYLGKHQPHISEELFVSVGRWLKDRSHPKRSKHIYRYRRQLRCRSCQGFLTGERQKRRVYYRCHRCPGVSVREDRIHDTKPSRGVSVETLTTRKLEAYQKFESHNLSATIVKKADKRPQISLP